ncbi:MAG: hypothetical protein ACQEUT_06910 [Bacillota bacterium]
MKKLAVILFIMSFCLIMHTPKLKGVTFANIDFYIEMTPWGKVDKVLPRNSIFTVIDIETGKRFTVQRRAGSSHADVQPLKDKDTKIMKEIYGGDWSWKRRAILVQSGNLLIASSMHGMPHGAGALQNGFPGHFCIHFKGSTTHKTHSPDFSHHLMILKAGGELDSFIQELEPISLVNTFLAGVKNGDEELVRKTMTNPKENLKTLGEVEAVRWQTSGVKSREQPFVKEIDAELKLYLKDSGPLNLSITFTVVKTSPTSPWRVDASPFLKLLRE